MSRTYFFTSLVFGLLLLFSGCRKDQRLLDTSVQPAEDLNSGAAAVTHSIRAFTTVHDSILSFPGATKFLGSNNDPVFGRTDIGLYLNANFTESNLNFGEDAVLDSAEFVFEVANADYQGDLFASLSFSIFAVDSVLNARRIYYASNNRLHSTQHIGEPLLAGVTVSAGITVLRLKLDSAYASQMIRDRDFLSSSQLFQSKYKGFYLAARAKPGEEGFIRKCNLESARSGLMVYYRRHPVNDLVTRSFRFSFVGENAVKYNTVKHDYSYAAAGLLSQLNGDTSTVQHLYVQGMGGCRANIFLPVQRYVNDTFHIAVGRAELSLYVDAAALASGYEPPPHLSLLPVAASGRDTLALDQANITDNSRYDGTYDKTNRRYVFNVARHVQAIYNGDKVNRGFRLVVSNPSKAATLFRDEYFNRVVLGGPAGSLPAPRFVISYSRVSKK